MATTLGTIATLQITPTAASSNSSQLLEIVVSISPALLVDIVAEEQARGEKVGVFECKFVRGPDLDNDAACDAADGDGVLRTPATRQDANTFRCPLPPWPLDQAFEQVSVVLKASGGVTTANLLQKCTNAPARKLLFIGTPTISGLLPPTGAVGTPILVNGTSMLDPDQEDPAFADARLASMCRFEGTMEVTAEWIDSSTMRCVAPVPFLAVGPPNPEVDVEVSNNGYDWSPPTRFRYETYCGGISEFTQAVGAFSDHNGGAFPLPNSLCQFKIAPQIDNAEDCPGGVGPCLAPGGVQLSFDTLDVGPEDTVKVYHTKEMEDGTQTLELLLDVGAYYSTANEAPPTSLLKSIQPAKAFHGLPVLVEFRTGPVTFTPGIAVSYVTLEPMTITVTDPVTNEVTQTVVYCPLPTLPCPSVTSNTGFSATETTQTASMLMAEEATSSGSVQVAGMAMHYFEVESQSAGVLVDDFRLVEVEVALVQQASAVSILLMEQTSLVNSTKLNADDAESGQCVDTTLRPDGRREALEVCPTGDFAADDSGQPRVVGMTTTSGGKVRLTYCLFPRESPEPDTFIRMVVGVYGVFAAPDEAASEIVAYTIKYRTLRMPQLDDPAGYPLLASFDGSLTSGPGGTGAIGWMRASPKFILQLTAELAVTGGPPGSLLIRMDQCPTDTSYLYRMQPDSAGAIGTSIAECNSTATACEEETTVTGSNDYVLWFVGLLSTAGVTTADDGATASVETRVQITDIGVGGYSALCDIGTRGIFTDTSCGGGAGGVTCTHLLAPSQTHHFKLKGVQPDEVLKVDACVTKSKQPGDACLDADEAMNQLIAVSIAPAQAAGVCLTAEDADQWAGALLADGAEGQWPVQGHYRLAKCTKADQSEWLVSVTARIDSSSSYVPYRLMIFYQSPSPSSMLEGQASEEPMIIHAGDWMYFYADVRSDAELTIVADILLTQLDPAGVTATSGAALSLHVSDEGLGCPGEIDPANVSAVSFAVTVTVPEPAQQLMLTLTPEPSSDCTAATAAVAPKRRYVGVYGESASLLLREGSNFKLQLGSSSLVLPPDQPRTVAVLAGSFIILQVDVSSASAIQVGATVSESSEPVEADSLNLYLMPGLDRDGACGAPILLSELYGRPEPKAVAPTAGSGQSALPLKLTRSTLDASGSLDLSLSVSECDNKTEGTWYLAMRVKDGGPGLIYAQLLVSEAPKQFSATDAKSGGLVSQQWAHFIVVTDTEGTISLNIDTKCFGGTTGACTNGEPWANSLTLYAQEKSVGDCANEGSPIASTQGAIQGDNTMRFSVNLCTSGQSTYFVGVQGGTDYGAESGNALDYAISGDIVPQSNLATFQKGQSLPITLSNGEWQYHYFELPDPTCATPAGGGCLQDVGSADQAKACYATDVADTQLHEINEACKALGASFPADVKLAVVPDQGDQVDWADVFLILGDCASLSGDGRLLTAAAGRYEKTYTAADLINEYVYAQLKFIGEIPESGRDCDANQVMSCNQCKERSPTGACEEPQLSCCFTPKIYAALNGKDAIVAPMEATFRLEPELQCSAGYRAAGGTYKDACDACEPGTYSKGNALACTPCASGYYSNAEVGMTGPTPCPAGTYNDAPGASACNDCDPGKFTETTGNFECRDCPPG